MTQEQRTPEAVHAIAECICMKVFGPDMRAWPNGLCNSIDDAITAAIRAENEACAKVCDGVYGKYFAAAIRARAP